MADPTFNLTTSPWLKVITLDNKIETVSLQDLFAHAQSYRRLAGDMATQDFAILRFLLAILHTVYSRLDADDEPYDWVTLDSATWHLQEVEADDFDSGILFDTWAQLKAQGTFTQGVATYLAKNADRFDLFGDQPFYQVTATQYDALVPANKRVATGTGTVAIKQINRRISESANSPAIFAPKTEATKNELTPAELARWLITYQGFTGVAEKTIIDAPEKYPKSAGWAYLLNPVYATGKTLFDTLLINLVLVPQNSETAAQASQRPEWEYPDALAYIADRQKKRQPQNLAELYTTWSRVLHLEWDDEDVPTLFSAGIPIFEKTNLFLEPMTTWRYDKKEGVFNPSRPGTYSLGKAMWRNFGQYIKLQDDEQNHQPGLIDWIAALKNQSLLDSHEPINLQTVTYINDGNATSQSPIAEVSDDMRIDANVLFDESNADWWPIRIENTIELTQHVGDDYWQFLSNIARLRNVDNRAFAVKESAKFYASLNRPFKQWLAGLSNQDNRDDKINVWKDTLRQLAWQAEQQLVATASPQEMRTIQTGTKSSTGLNIFTAANHFRWRVTQDLTKG